jgi:hypothetical protein
MPQIHGDGRIDADDRNRPRCSPALRHHLMIKERARGNRSYFQQVGFESLITPFIGANA